MSNNKKKDLLVRLKMLGDALMTTEKPKAKAEAKNSILAGMVVVRSLCVRQKPRLSRHNVCDIQP